MRLFHESTLHRSHLARTVLRDRCHDRRLGRWMVDPASARAGQRDESDIECPALRAAGIDRANGSRAVVRIAENMPVNASVCTERNFPPALRRRRAGRGRWGKAEGRLASFDAFHSARLGSTLSPRRVLRVWHVRIVRATHLEFWLYMYSAHGPPHANPFCGAAAARATLDEYSAQLSEQVSPPRGAAQAETTLRCGGGPVSAVAPASLVCRHDAPFPSTNSEP